MQRFIGLGCLLLLAFACDKKKAESNSKPIAEALPKAAPAEPQAKVAPAKRDPLAAPEDVAAPPKDAAQTASGLASKVIEKGSGNAHPESADRVTVHYSGWTTDGKLFDSSFRRGQPATFPLDQVIAGWTEGLQLMVKGETRRLWIPEALAYKGMPGKPKGMLVFDVKLIDFASMKAVGPKPPEPIDTPPEKAKKTRTGIRYVVLKKAERKAAKPKLESRVKVNYAGWTTDGKLFDSSFRRQQPAVFALRQVIPGWQQALQLMQVGETAVFWIPKELAYEGLPGPQGTLVFHIELLDILGG